MMTPHQIELVQTSFAAIAPRAEEVAAAFYERLFALDPSLRAMFPVGMVRQRRKLMAALAMAVQALDRPQVLVPALEALGRRHATYGVRDEHYATVGAALLATLEAGLGERFDAASRTAWAACYDLVATTMRNAGRSKDAYAAAA
jgi:hemoglobin-like flavoprotein